MSISKYALFLFTILATACNTSDENQEKPALVYNKLKQAEWILGNWKNISEDQVATETWSRLNDSVLSGSSLITIDKDTISSETIRIEQHGDTVYYIPTVKDLNDNKPIRFTMILLSDTSMAFVNPAHDFPQQITYKKVNEDSLFAEISGTKNGKFMSIPFPFKRAQ